MFFLSGVVLFAALFTINFLRIPEVFPRIYHLGTALVVISVLVMLATLLLPYKLMIRVVIGWAVFAITIALTIGTYRWLHGDSSAKYYCIAWYTLLIGGVVLALNKFDVIPRNFFTENATQLGSALEVILLSFALADRLNTEKRKRYEAQLQALENERIARLAQAEALQQEKNARIAQEKALEHERDARVEGEGAEVLEHAPAERDPRPLALGQCGVLRVARHQHRLVGIDRLRRAQRVQHRVEVGAERVAREAARVEREEEVPDGPVRVRRLGPGGRPAEDRREDLRQHGEAVALVAAQLRAAAERKEVAS